MTALLAIGKLNPIDPVHATRTKIATRFIVLEQIAALRAAIDRFHE